MPEQIPVARRIIESADKADDGFVADLLIENGDVVFVNQ